MRFLVDVNILSEPTRQAPDQNVLAWLKRYEREIAIDPIILGEIRFGILKLPKGRKRSQLEAWFDLVVQRVHCLPWEARTGLRWAELVMRLRAAGEAMPIVDSMVAATALTFDLTLATRDEIDFSKSGVKLTNPFKG